MIMDVVVVVYVPWSLSFDPYDSEVESPRSFVSSRTDDGRRMVRSLSSSSLKW